MEVFSGSDQVDQERQTPTAEPEFSSPGEDELHSLVTMVTDGGEGQCKNPMALLFIFILMSVFCGFSIPSQGQVPGLVKRGGLDRILLNSPKGIWFMTGLLLSSKIQGNLNFIQGRRNLSPTHSSLASFAFHPP